MLLLAGKSDDPTSPDYIPTVFAHVPPAKKSKRLSQVADHERRKRRCEKYSFVIPLASEVSLHLCNTETCNLMICSYFSLVRFT